MVGEKFFKDPGSMWVGGAPPFFPTPEAGESNMEIVFPEDGHGFALRQLILFAPRGKFFHRGWILLRRTSAAYALPVCTLAV